MQILVKEVISKKEIMQFTELPIKLFGHIEEFVPALTVDEINVFDKVKNPAHEYCESIRFLAYMDNKVVGRIAGIINHKYNEEFKTQIVRFTRIDMIDNIEVTKALLEKVEQWGKDKGMTDIIGPIGFTDMDRMGLLVEGFEYLGSFITIWNPDYYKEHLNELGYIKDVDWIESRIPWPKTVPERVEKASRIVKTRYNYELVKVKSFKELPNYIYDAFDVYNDAFKELYGFAPISTKVRDYYINQMKYIIKYEFLWFVRDKFKKVIGFGIMMPSLAIANKKNNGRLLPFGIFRLLRSLKKFSVIDFYFIAVDPKYQGTGVLSLIMEDAVKQTENYNITHAETGPELELNTKIQSQWEPFNPYNHKRRRCFKKKL